MSFLNSLIPALNRSACATTDATREHTAPGVRPAYTITESAEAYALTVQLPGVAKGGVTLTDEDGVITLRGERAWQQPAGWTALYRETGDRPFALELRHDQAIAVDKIQAEISDGVLRATLPKAEARKPRKIAIA